MSSTYRQKSRSVAGFKTALTVVLLVVTSVVTIGASPASASAKPRVQQLQTNSSTSCVLFQTGEVSCWGDGRALGSGSLDNSSTPVPVVGIDDQNTRLTGVKELTTGGGVSPCVLMKSGRVACWGVNAWGQLGSTTSTDVTETGSEVSTRPVLVRGLDGSGYLEGVKQVVVGVNSSCALLKRGRVACWGQNSLGQLGSDEATEMTDTGLPFSSTPLLVQDTSGSGALSGVKELSSSGLHTCALLRDGQVACWGFNGGGALGATTEGSSSSTPVIAHPDDPALKQVKQVSTGIFHTCVLSLQGTVSCWGANFSSSLGDGTTTSSRTPVAVKPIGGGEGRLTGVKRLHVGGTATCVELRSSEVACWGQNVNGKLGNGSEENSSVPVVPLGVDGVGELGKVKAIAPSGGFHACALQKDNQVVCWGDNRSGQLGNGSTETSLFPVTVVGLP